MQYKLDIPKFSEPPEVRIGDKMYPINNRKSVVDTIDARLRKEPGKELDIILECALGKEAAKEIMASDYPMPVLQELMIIIRAGLTGITLEEARAQFRGKE